MKQTEYFGPGSIKNLNLILQEENSKNIFLVCGKESFETSGAKHYIDQFSQEYFFTRFSDFSSNPKIEQIQAGLELFNQRGYDTILAVGGGSPIDVAKAIKLFALEKSPKRKLPLIAIPTTSGSGSEATHFIVYYKGGVKQSAGNKEITLPEYAIIDPLLTLSLPSYQTACTGLDALSQAIESYWCINSTDESKSYAREAISLVLGNLEEAVKHPENITARSAMAKSANLAGKAINISKTTACHAIAYPITSKFNIPHGHACALTLAEMLDYNSRISDVRECNDSRGLEYVEKTMKELVEIVGAKDVAEAKKIINTLMNRVGAKTKLSELGIDDIEYILDNGFAPERVKNNPRFLTKENLNKILLFIQ